MPVRVPVPEKDREGVEMLKKALFICFIALYGHSSLFSVLPREKIHRAAWPLYDALVERVHWCKQRGTKKLQRKIEAATEKAVVLLSDLSNQVESEEIWKRDHVTKNLRDLYRLEWDKGLSFESGIKAALTKVAKSTGDNNGVTLYDKVKSLAKTLFGIFIDPSRLQSRWFGGFTAKVGAALAVTAALYALYRLGRKGDDKESRELMQRYDESQRRGWNGIANIETPRLLQRLNALLERQRPIRRLTARRVARLYAPENWDPVEDVRWPWEIEEKIKNGNLYGGVEIDGDVVIPFGLHVVLDESEQRHLPDLCIFRDDLLPEDYFAAIPHMRQQLPCMTWPKDYSRQQFFFDASPNFALFSKEDQEQILYYTCLSGEHPRNRSYEQGKMVQKWVASLDRLIERWEKGDKEAQREVQALLKKCPIPDNIHNLLYRRDKKYFFIVPPEHRDSPHQTPESQVIRDAWRRSKREFEAKGKGGLWGNYDEDNTRHEWSDERRRLEFCRDIGGMAVTDPGVPLHSSPDVLMRSGEAYRRQAEDMATKRLTQFKSFLERTARARGAGYRLSLYVHNQSKRGEEVSQDKRKALVKAYVEADDPRQTVLGKVQALDADLLLPPQASLIGNIARGVQKIAQILFRGGSEPSDAYERRKAVNDEKFAQLDREIDRLVGQEREKERASLRMPLRKKEKRDVVWRMDRKKGLGRNGAPVTRREVCDRIIRPTIERAEERLTPDADGKVIAHVHPFYWFKFPEVEDIMPVYPDDDRLSFFYKQMIGEVNLPIEHYKPVEGVDLSGGDRGEVFLKHPHRNVRHRLIRSKREGVARLWSDIARWEDLCVGDPEGPCNKGYENFLTFMATIGPYNGDFREIVDRRNHPKAEEYERKRAEFAEQYPLEELFAYQKAKDDYHKQVNAYHHWKSSYDPVFGRYISYVTEDDPAPPCPEYPDEPESPLPMNELGRARSAWSALQTQYQFYSEEERNMLLSLDEKDHYSDGTDSEGYDRSGESFTEEEAAAEDAANLADIIDVSLGTMSGAGTGAGAGSGEA